MYLIIYGNARGGVLFAFHGKTSAQFTIKLLERKCDLGRDYVHFSNGNGELILFLIYSIRNLDGYGVQGTIIIIFFCTYNGGGLTRRVLVRRVSGQEKGYAVSVCISMEAWLKFLDLLSYCYCCP